MNTTELQGFSVSPFAAEGYEYPVYRGGQGPGVLVMHEVPGITPSVADFSRRLIAAGFTVAMPSIFGKPNKPLTTGYALRQIARACVRSEFRMLASRESSPITDYFRAVARDLHERCGGPGVGAIGMCLTGNFAMTLMLEPSVIAPVLSQPSMPFALGKKRKRELHLSDDALEHLKRRVAQPGCSLLAMRFTHDPMVPAERFERLRDELGDGVETLEIDSSKGNPWGFTKSSHSVVTTEFMDEEGHPTRAAMDRVLAHFSSALRPS